MPICPKCKNEYRDGFNVCAECKCYLIDSFEEIADEKVISKENLKLVVEEQQESVTTEKKECPRDEYKSGIYRNSAERAEDNKSSAWTLLSVGVVGIIVLVLVMIGLIPIHFYGITKYMVYGVMFALFILFIVMGLVSLRNSKIFAKKAESESSLSDTMKEWCLANLNAEELDENLFGIEENNESISSGEEVSEEEKYFKRNEEIKRLISDKFMNLDEGFLEDFVDHIYDEMFED